MEETKEKNPVGRPKEFKYKGWDHEPDTIRLIEQIALKQGKSKAEVFRESLRLGLSFVEVKEDGYSIFVAKVENQYMKLIEEFAVHLDMTADQIIEMCVKEQLM